MITKKISLLFFLFFSIVCFSQGWDADPGFGGGAGDPATEPVATPIDGIEMPLLITAIVVAIVVIRRKQKSAA
jgi:hypothetical protein